MKRMASVLSVLPLCAGLMVAQTTGAQGQDARSPQTQGQTAGQGQSQDHNQHNQGQATGQHGQTGMQNIGNGQPFYGILVAAGCSGSGMTGGTAGAGHMNTGATTGHAGDQTMMNRTTPGTTSDRTWNTTDRNTAGAADRGATGTGATGTADINRRTPDATTGTDRSDNRTGQTGTTGSTGQHGQTGTAAQHGQTGTTGQHGQTGTTAQHGQTGTTAQHGQTGTTGQYGQTGTTGQQHTGSADRQSDSNWWSTTGDVASADRKGNWNDSCFITPTTTSFMLHTQDGRMIRLDDSSNSKVVSQLQNTQRVQDAHKIFRVRVSGSLSGDQFSVTNIEM
jgi:collagen type VII alpha